MTTRDATRLLPITTTDSPAPPLWDRMWVVGFAPFQWPWLLKSLYGGTRESKKDLLRRVQLPSDALPHLGSWKADTYLLHRLVDLIEQRKPRTVVELGSGATTLIVAKALQQHVPNGRLISFDQNANFVLAVDQWLHENGVSAELRHAPLSSRSADWPGRWYDLSDVPPKIDMLIVDGPPWTIHPYVRGAAETLFPRLSDRAVIVLDDAARPGERLVAQRWKRNWPAMRFEFENGGSKGTLIGCRTS